MPQRHVIVIGGGPAGLMAAGQSALLGAHVTLLEKMPRPARKLRITGKGRCNLTNDRPVHEFVERFGRNGRFLRSSFSQFFKDELIEFIEGLGVSLTVERGARVFPTNDRAQDVVDALVRWTRQCGVSIRTDSAVSKLVVEDGCVVGAVALGAVEHADAIILATGGASYPLTGSTGDGYELARSVGHTVIPIRPSLVPLVAGEEVTRSLAGLKLRNVGAALWVDGKKAASDFGEMAFAEYGLTGPIILSLSRAAVDALEAKRHVELSIDLKPAVDDGRLDKRLLRDIADARSREFATLLKGLLPRQLIPACIEQTAIDAHTPAHQIGAKDRKRLCRWLKDWRFKITGSRGLDEAIVTAGGVDLREIDPRTMASRKADGLYIAGELLDLDADTGGFNLQAAFSTGWVAGHAAADVD